MSSTALLSCAVLATELLLGQHGLQRIDKAPSEQLASIGLLGASPESSLDHAERCIQYQPPPKLHDKPRLAQFFRQFPSRLSGEPIHYGGLTV